jgi:hypothetical protein
VSLILFVSLLALAVILFVLPAAVVLRDLRAGRRDPSGHEGTMR